MGQFSMTILPYTGSVLTDIQQSSIDKTFTMDEAKTVLKSTRAETKIELRWVPWLCAYSGARINEIAQLTPNDFFKHGDDWFFNINNKGGKSLKNASSYRQVPIHPDLIQEGLIALVISLCHT